MKRQEGFSLIELVVVVVVIGILASIAVIGYRAVMSGTRDKLQTARVMQFAEAQNKFRTVLGKRRYGTITELCQAGLLNESVGKFDASCVQQSLNGWTLISDSESIEYLREHFSVRLEQNDVNRDTAVTYCIREDGVLRSWPGSKTSKCITNGKPYQP